MEQKVRKEDSLMEESTNAFYGRGDSSTLEATSEFYRRGNSSNIEATSEFYRRGSSNMEPSEFYGRESRSSFYNRDDYVDSVLEELTRHSIHRQTEAVLLDMEFAKPEDEEAILDRIRKTREERKQERASLIASCDNYDRERSDLAKRGSLAESSCSEMSFSCGRDGSYITITDEDMAAAARECSERFENFKAFRAKEAELADVAIRVACLETKCEELRDKLAETKTVDEFEDIICCIDELEETKVPLINKLERLEKSAFRLKRKVVD